MTASDRRSSSSQVWLVSYPDGKATRVTNDLHRYYGVSLTADSSVMIAMRYNLQRQLLIAPNGDAGRARQFISGDDSIYDISCTPDNRIIYSSTVSGGTAISIMDACSYSSPQYRAATPATAYRTAVIPIGGGEPVKDFDLMGGPENDFGWTADSRALTYIVTRGGVSNIWSQPLDGGRPKQLTDFKSGQIYSFDWSRDGKQLLALRGTPSNDAVIINDFK